MVYERYEFIVILISTLILISSPTSIKNTFDGLKNIVKYYTD